MVGVSKIFSALTGSELCRESGFKLSIVVFGVCTYFQRRRGKHALLTITYTRFFLLYYFSCHPSGSCLTTLVATLVATTLGFLVLRGVVFKGYLIVSTV